MREEKHGLAEENGRRIPRLYCWYIGKRIREDGTGYYQAHGCVAGHTRLPDTMFIETSEILHVEVEEATEEAVIRTRNTEYHCRLSDCDFAKPDTYVLIPGLEQYAEKYGRKREYIQEDNSILLVLSDHQMYYFETMRIRKDGKTYEGSMHPHIGMLQDSCLISCWEYTISECRESEDFEKQVDIRYFPHHQHLETYCWQTGGLPVYLENAGDEILYYTVREGVMELKPGERKLVSKDHVMADDQVPLLDRSDLYPMVEVGGEISEMADLFDW